MRALDVVLPGREEERRGAQREAQEVREHDDYHDMCDQVPFCCDLCSPVRAAAVAAGVPTSAGRAGDEDVRQHGCSGGHGDCEGRKERKRGTVSLGDRRRVVRKGACGECSAEDGRRARHEGSELRGRRDALRQSAAGRAIGTQAHRRYMPSIPPPHVVRTDLVRAWCGAADRGLHAVRAAQRSAGSRTCTKEKEQRKAEKADNIKDRILILTYMTGNTNWAILSSIYPFSLSSPSCFLCVSHWRPVTGAETSGQRAAASAPLDDWRPPRRSQSKRLTGGSSQSNPGWIHERGTTHRHRNTHRHTHTSHCIIILLPCHQASPLEDLSGLRTLPLRHSNLRTQASTLLPPHKRF